MLTLVRIEWERLDFLGVNIDLLTEASISQYFIDKINKEAKVISE